MELRTILDRTILKRCDNLTRECIRDPDRAAEVAQEVYLYMLETYHPSVNWTEGKVIEVFQSQINAADCRLKRLFDIDQPERLADQTGGVDPDYTDLENLDIISQLPTNLTETAGLLYAGHTVSQTATIQRISTAHVYRRRIAIQEILL